MSSQDEEISTRKQTFFISIQGPVVQSVVSLTSSLRVISVTVLEKSIYNILICFAEKNVSSFCTAHFFSNKFQHICVSLDVNFNESLTNDIVSFEQLGPERFFECLIYSILRSNNIVNPDQPEHPHSLVKVYVLQQYNL